MADFYFPDESRPPASELPLIGRHLGEAREIASWFLRKNIPEDASDQINAMEEELLARKIDECVARHIHKASLRN